MLVFFATPHQGGNYAHFGDVIAKMVRKLLGKQRNDIVDSLKEYSEAAEKRFDQARHLPRSCKIVSFYESAGALPIVSFPNRPRNLAGHF